MTIPHRRRLRSPFALMVLVLLASAHYTDSAHHPPYMYAAMSPEEHYPVHELLINETYSVESSISDQQATGEIAGTADAANETKTNATEPLRLPTFLTSAAGHRVVEFYAPWCPHCRHFRDQFIQFSRQVTSLATRLGSHIDVHAVSCQMHHPICQHERISGFPWILIIPDGSLNGTRVKHHDLHPFGVLDMFGIATDELSSEEHDLGTTLELSSSNSLKQIATNEGVVAARTKDDLYIDAFLSFDMAMRQSVYTAPGKLKLVKSHTFKDWINLLHDTLPPMWRIHRQISAIREDLDNAVKNEANLLALIDEHKPQTDEWSFGCSHGEEGMGYTCGLWELFHIMTIGVVEWNTMANEWSIIPTMQAADTLRRYVEHFFGCEVCSHNFMKAYDACSFDRCNRLIRRDGKLADWKELPLWLWETHNAVNVRLMKERAAREARTWSHQDEIDAQWPSRKDCPRCWQPDGMWNEEFIYMYLRLEYWPDDEGSQETRRYLSTTKSLLEDDDEYNSYYRGFGDYIPSLQLFTVSSVGLLALYVSHAKKVQRQLSGHHKKFEDDLAV